MRPVAARSQVSMGAVVVEENLDKNIARLNVVLPDFLSRYFHHSLAGKAAVEDVREPFAFGIVFQEVLRRYSGQKTVAIRFAGDLALPGIHSLESNDSLRETIIRLRTPGDALDRSDSTSAVLDGEFFFKHLPDGLDEPKLSPGASAMCFVLQGSASGLAGFLQFERRIWDAEVVKSFWSSYTNLLQAALNNPDVPLGELDILTAGDRATFAAWNDTGRYYPRARVDKLFDLRVLERPDDPAVTFLDRSLTYSELSEKTKQIAIRLQKLGAQPGTLVGICMDRCEDTVVALLAIFRTGAAYLPLDPAFPEARLEFMQVDAQPLIVLTQSHLLEKFSFVAPHVLCIDDEAPQSGSSSSVECLPAQPSSLDDVAYVLYTSGSTGKPKGVQITHRALINMLTVVSEDVDLVREDVVLATTTISFDISTFEIFAPLIAGAHLVMAPRSVAMNGELLAEAIRESSATLLQATPAGWRILLESGWEGHAGLRMLTAGEPLSWTLAQRLLDRGARLWNLYGPTEVTVYAAGREIYKDTNKITVGPALANYTAYVLDQQRQLLPIGAIGELYLGGIGVGAGYLNRPELTAEKFLPNPFSSEPRARMYRTGDLARMLPDGEIDLLGRADNQIKLRGYRIELEEIEGALDRHPGIAKSVATVVSLIEGDPSLVVYVAPRDHVTVDEKDWRRHALANLPSYMVPSSFMVVKSFTLTPNGKVDRKVLPAFEFADLIAVEQHGARGGLEQTVLHCWRGVLGRPGLGLDHNFFDAGGHSLLVMRMFTEMNNILGCKLPISLLVEAPTARQFAACAPRAKDDPAKYLVLMQPQGSLPPVYLVHHLLGDILIYRNVANQFAPERPVYGIQSPADLIDRPQPYSLQSLASDYVAEILARQTAGPIHLAGFSSGSIIAFEMARQLKQLGFQVGMVALIDGNVETEGPRMPVAVRYTKLVARKLCKIWFKLRDELAAGPRQFVGKRLRHWWLQARIRILERSSSQGKVTMEQALLLAERAYEGEPYDGSALLIRFHDEAWKFGPDPLMGWSSLVKGGIDVVDLPGGHITGMGELGAPVMVDLLRHQIETFEATLRESQTKDATTRDWQLL